MEICGIVQDRRKYEIKLEENALYNVLTYLGLPKKITVIFPAYWDEH